MLASGDLRRWLSGLGIVVLAGAVWNAGNASATTIDLGSLIANPSFDEAATTVDWTATQPNSSYLSSVPVNPTINPVDPSQNDGSTLPALVAQFGPNFVGIRNGTQNDDLKGKLVSDAIAASFSSDARFEIRVFGNRGRLDTNGNTNGQFPKATTAPRVRVQFWGFGPGVLPTVNSSDDWSRSHASKITETFDFGTTDPGAWTEQTFAFEPGVSLEYVAVALIGQNLNHDQYVAMDVQVVPEPSSALLLSLGLVVLATTRRHR